MNPLCYKIFISSPKEQNAVQSVWCHLPWSLQCWTTPLYFASCLCVFVYFCEFWFPPGLFLFWRWWFPTFSISNAAIKLWLQLAAWLFCRWFSSCLCFSCSSLSWTLLSLFSLRDHLLAGHRSLAGFLCWKMDSWLSSVQKYWCSQTFSSGCVFSLFYRKSEENKSVLIICRFLCISIVTQKTVNYYQTVFIHKSLKAFIHRCILFWHMSILHFDDKFF